MKINQGELFKFAATTGGVKDWVEGLERYDHFLFADSPPQPKDCLVKLSCETVHNLLVPTNLTSPPLQRSTVVEK
jgi:hypothetical protein